MKVLIIRIGAMGDVLHTMPAVAALKELHPEWEIGWAIEPRWSELLQSAEDFDRHPHLERNAAKPLVDRWHQVPTKAWAKRPLALSTLSEINTTRRELAAWKYDVCVDMQGSIKSAVVGRMAGARHFVGMAKPREQQAAWLYGQRVKVTAAHVVAQGCELLGAAVGEILRPGKVSLPVDEAAERWCDGWLRGMTEPFVLMAPTAGWGAKEWPAERYGAVAVELGRAGYRTLVNASTFGDAVAEAVVEASDGSATAIPCSIGQLIAVTRRAALVIAGDTGPLHLAAALERPVVGLYGPTDPARNGPYGTQSVVLRDASSGTDHSRVAKSGLLGIAVETVAEAALSCLHSHS